jgi:CheY-like chemotaxis protein
VSPVHEEFLGDILASSKHLLQLINDILDLAKVEAGKMEIRPEPVDLRTLVGEVIEILRGMASAKRLQLDTAVDDDVANVVADPARVKQILYNYLSNAIKFTEDGGRVHVRIFGDGPEFFRIDVEDTGPGIGEADLAQLFVEFQQLESGAAKRHQGTGLGLALTHRLVSAHGGRVAVRSTVGIGSTFSAILPRVTGADHSAPFALLPDAGSPLAGNRTILIIEDDPATRKIAEIAVRELGYRAVCTSSGEQGLGFARSESPAAVIVDLHMPIMNGFEFVTRLRASETGKTVPVIVWTVKDLEAEERRQLEAMRASVISKRLGGPESLIEQLRRFQA